MVTLIEGSEIVYSVGSSYGKLEKAMYLCDAINRTCGSCSNGTCKKRYSSIIKKKKKLPKTYEQEASVEYGSIVK